MCANATQKGRHIRIRYLSFQGEVVGAKVLEARAKDPKNADVAARLAERFLQVGDKKEAGKLAEAALAEKKVI